MILTLILLSGFVLFCDNTFPEKGTMIAINGTIMIMKITKNGTSINEVNSLMFLKLVLILVLLNASPYLCASLMMY